MIRLPWRSLSGQLFLLWLGATLLIHLVTLASLRFWQDSHRVVHQAALHSIELQIQSVVKAISNPLNDTEKLLDQLSLPDATLELIPKPTLTTKIMNGHEHAFAERLHQQLALAPTQAVYVHLRHVPLPRQPIAREEAHTLWSRLQRLFVSNTQSVLDIELPLANGQWLHNRNSPMLESTHWMRILSVSLMLSTLPAALIIILLTRRILRPLRELAHASLLVSRGEEIQLPEPTGPGGVVEIVRAFNTMQARLLRYVRGRTQMIAAIGHDLRTPLTSLRIRAELVDDAKLRTDIIRTLDELRLIIDETQAFAREDAEHEQRQSINLRELVAAVLEHQQVLGHAITLIDHLPPDFVYRCSPVQFKRALGNLTDNAARHGAVTITLRNTNTHLYIDIADTGPGIAPALLEQVFEPFMRLDESRNLNQGNLGLGLAIARSSIRAHGGEVTLSNRPEGGLCASIRVPL